MAGANPLVTQLPILEASLRNDYPALHISSNAVARSAREGQLNANAMVGALRQYSLLPATIVELIETAIRKLSEWDNVRQALEENLEQETGSETHGRPHYAILVTGCQVEAQIDIANVVPTVATDKFLNDLRQYLERYSPPYVAGAIFALEASALLELPVVAHLLNEHARLRGKGILIPMEQLTDPAFACRPVAPDERYTLAQFFAAHLVTFEQEHRDGLARSLGEHINGEPQLRAFIKGFQFVLDAMECWWASIASDAIGSTEATLAVGSEAL